VCARRGARSPGGTRGRSIGFAWWTFSNERICLRRFGSPRPGPDRPNEAHPGTTSASANKRAGRFQVVSRSLLHHAVTSEQGTELSSSETDRKQDRGMCELRCMTMMLHPTLRSLQSQTMKVADHSSHLNVFMECHHHNPQPQSCQAD
jgi:hypothetical protein